MYCPYCKHTDSRVVDSRTTDDGAAIRRRRQCTSCARRFTTVETTTISVIKRSGVTEPSTVRRLPRACVRHARAAPWVRTIWRSSPRRLRS